MKLKSFFTLLAASCLAVSCTNDEMADVITDDAPQENELRLVFSSSTNGEVYPVTKAIASEEENAIDNLTIYVFGASSETGTYYYIDKWTSAAAQNNGSSQFALQPSGSGMKASIYPKSVTNAQYLKLYCVANSKVISTPTSATEFTTSPGTSVTSGTTETTFKTYWTEKVADEAIKTPLAMTGVTEPIHVTGNYAAVNVQLKRRVARFDIDNNSARTKLTIQKLSIVQADSYSCLFSETPVSGALIDYPEVDYTKLENANLGETPSALYVHPTTASNNLMLVIKGLYAGKNEVTYRVKVARTAEGGSSATNLDIQANHRYKLRISEVTNSEIVGYFEVEDWVDGGSVEVKPNYDQKPEFVEIKAGTTSPFTGLEEDEIMVAKDSAICVTGAGTFTMKVKAPADCSVKVSTYPGFITRAVSEVTNWLSAGAPTVTDEDGMRVSTFTFTVAASVANNAAPMLLTFVNNAASVDPAFQLRYRVLPPAVLNYTTNIAAASDTDYPNNSSNGAIVNTKGSEKLTLNLGKKYYVDVCSPYLAVPTSAVEAKGLKITEVARNVNTHTVTYCFDLQSLPEDIDVEQDNYKLTFENKEAQYGLDKQSVEYKLVLNSSETVVNAEKPTGESYQTDEGWALNVTSPDKPTATITNVKYKYLYVKFAKEMTFVPPTGVTNFTIAEAGQEDGEYVYSITLKTTFDEGSFANPYNIVFKNKLDTRKQTTLAITVSTAGE